MKPKLPRIAITMGDPAGIGPEICLKALVSPKLSSACAAFIVGDLDIVRETARALGIVRPVCAMPSARTLRAGAINVLEIKINSVRRRAIGKAQKICGRAAYAYIVKAIELAQSRVVDAIVTAPINKEALHLAAIPYPGHTEILADKTGVADFSMMFACERVHVVHVTTHMSVRQALKLITRKRVLAHTRQLNRALKELGYAAPRIAVAGLNPHAGENGLFGSEEIVHIAPAIAQARREGIEVSGPYPPDTVFMNAFKGRFDGVVSMLHDHGFVALKSRDFEAGVNVTLGLPIIRTSVGHGTAFDIAGKGIASEKSMLAAIRYALKMVKHRRLK